jgi:hypothetical protein
VGRIDPVARADAGRRWWNALPEQQAEEVLAAVGMPARVAAVLVGERPVPQDGPAPEPMMVLLDGPDRPT